jgi:polygalacturonase
MSVISNLNILLIIITLTFVACDAKRMATSSTDISISVTEFGARPNDLKDDSQNFRKALSFLKEKGGGILTIPKGIFLISRTNDRYPGGIYIPSNVTLRGLDAKQSILKLQPQQGNFTRLIYVENASNVVIDKITIDGNRREQPNPGQPNEHLHGVFINSSENVILKNCTFQNTGGDGILIHGPKIQSKSILIQDCSFKKNRRNGITLGSGFNGVVIDNCYFDATEIFASPIDSEPDNGKCENVKFINNTIVNKKNKSTIVTLGGHVPVLGYEIYNNKFQNCGLHLVRAYNANIFDNQIDTKGTIAGINAIYESKNISIHDNNIQAETDAIKLIATKYSYPLDFKIYNNKLAVTGKKSYSIRIQGARNITIENNILLSQTQGKAIGGIYVRSTREVENIQITKNKLINFQEGLTIATYQKYKISNLSFEKNELDITSQKMINYTCPKSQIGLQVTIAEKDNIHISTKKTDK